jgi:hypothetical protein
MPVLLPLPVSGRGQGGEVSSPIASGAASASLKSVSSIRRPMLKGVSRVSRIRSEGEATPSRQKVSRAYSGSSARRL